MKLSRAIIYLILIGIVVLVLRQTPGSNAGSVGFEIETVVEGLKSPWAVVPAPDGRMFITERPGRLRILKNDKLSEPIKGVPKVAYVGQGGLLDLALHPDFEHNRILYLVYSCEEGDVYQVCLSRFNETINGLANEKLIFKTDDGTDDPAHFGSRLAFGLDGKLYVTLGERHEPERAQDLSHYNGKTLRLNDDGTAPNDNPFIKREGAHPEIFSYGHRNPQGMDIQAGTGRIFQTEHGPSWYDARGGGDEINIVEAGKNYGWPEIHHGEEKEGMVTPLHYYSFSEPPSGAAFYTGDAFPQWRGDFFFATLKSKTLHRLKIEGRKVVEDEELLEDQYGRLRDVAIGLEGYIYILTSDTDAYGPGREHGDRLLRLKPTSQ